MESIQSIELTIPLWEIVLLGIVCLLCMLTDRVKLGLFATFIFVFYWGLGVTFSDEGSGAVGCQFFDALYLFLGLGVVLIYLIYWFFTSND